MMFLCDRPCNNKTEYGYCMTSYCLYPVVPTVTEIGTFVQPKETGLLKKTNGDRIRSMTDEELAEWISGQIDCEVCRLDYGGGERPCDNRCCLDFWLDWLREEVDE